MAEQQRRDDTRENPEVGKSDNVRLLDIKSCVQVAREHANVEDVSIEGARRWDRAGLML